MKAGAADFVTKPWTNAQILQSVETALGLAASRAGRGETACPRREELDARFDFGDAHRTRPAAAADPGADRPRRADRRLGADHRRERHGQGAGRGSHPPQQPPRAGPVRQGEPRRHLRDALRERDVRPRARARSPTPAQDRKGRFEVADGGTIFLDEIGELDPASQVKLLRVLQDRTFEVLGSSQRRTVDVRVVSATNRNLAEMVARGEFREDLLYRLNLIAVHLPPLRERRDDIPLLASHFLRRSAQVYRREGVAPEPPAPIAWLQAQPWPGNIRQLRQTIERARARDRAATCSRPTISGPPPTWNRATRARDTLPGRRQHDARRDREGDDREVLKHYDGNVSKVAEALGLSRAALYRRFEKYEIHV